MKLFVGNSYRVHAATIFGRNVSLDITDSFLYGLGPMSATYYSYLITLGEEIFTIINFYDFFRTFRVN